MIRLLFSLVLLALFAVGSLGLNNGVGRRPQMGYNTWNDYTCSISETTVKAAANAMVSQKLNTVGYQYVNIDDCWASGRYSDGTIYPNSNKFPNGMQALASYVHSLGLKFGLYTDRGDYTCMGYPGSLGYETIDAQTYASWGVDYVKEDSCSAASDETTAFAEYGKMRDALNATGRPIFFSLCGQATWYAPTGGTIGNSWRIGSDCTDWSSIVHSINTNANLWSYAKPGGWNDPDMLLGSSSSAIYYVQPYQSRTQFSMWAVMAAPLLIGSHIVSLNTYDLATYSNVNVISINQDSLGIQGKRVGGGTLVTQKPRRSSGQSTWNVWTKPLSNGKTAMVLLNNAYYAASVTCSSSCFSNAGLKASSYSMFDAWANSTIGTTTPQTGYTAINLQASGGSQTIILTPL